MKYIPSLPILAAIPAGIIGNRLGVASKAKAEAKPQTARVCTAEIDDHGNIMQGGRSMAWLTTDIDFVTGSVGSTVNLGRTRQNCEAEKWRAKVIHVYDICTGEDLV